MIATQLFESQNLRLTSIDPEQDSKIEAAWTYDLDYAKNVLDAPTRPLGALELKKNHEEEQKKADERGNQYYFAIRLKEGNQLAGTVRFPFVFWVHASARLRLGIADPDILARFGQEALQMALRYSFTELNLYRVETVLPEYQHEMIDVFECAGFLQEIRRRQVFYRNGRYFDALHFGLLQDEWKTQGAVEVLS
jgi:RimJ/RimL family protein N-acetyltransferase